MKITMKIVAILLCLLLCQQLLLINPARAVLYPLSGSGTQLAPYLISSSKDLLWMSEKISALSGFSGVYFRQTQDIDMAGVTFSPIGDSTYPFDAFYDGNYKAIRNLTLNNGSTDVLGLFGYINSSGTVKNVFMTDVSISSSNRDQWGFGAIAGYNDWGTITNCHVTGNISISGYCGMSYNYCEVGGIVGYSHGGFVENCSVSGTGANGQVSVSAAADVGVEADLGGIVGLIGYSARVRNCYNIGDITNASTVNPTTGGIVGYDFLQGAGAYIENCYNIGTITGTDYVGGIVGHSQPGRAFLSNYYLTGCVVTSGLNVNNTGASKLSADLKTQNTYIGWDFSSIWIIDASLNSGYPDIIQPYPSSSTGVASSVSSTGATLNGTIIANGYSTVVTFEYGTTNAYGSSATASQSPVSGSSATSVSTGLTGLAPNTTYHYRVVGVNSGGTTTGSDATFTTLPAAPTISSVSAPGNATYAIGQNLDYTVNFSSSVNVVTTGGTPYLTLTVGSSSKQAAYVSGSGTSALTFRYTVASGDEDTDGVALSSNITLNGGTIKDSNSNDAGLTFTGSTAAGVKVDGVAPTISSVSAPSNATYSIGQNLDYTVNFSSSVNVVTTGGTPYLTLTVGSSSKQAAYVSGSGTSALSFRYTVASGDEDTDGVALSSNITLNGGTIKDAAGNNAVLTFTDSTAAGVKVDTTAPTISSGTIIAGNTTPSSADLFWSAASDTVTTTSNLEYKVVYSTSSNISTVSNAESNGTTAQDWTANITSLTVSSLNASTPYYFNVLVKDEAGCKSIYTVVNGLTSAPAVVPAVAKSLVVEVDGQKQDAGSRNTETAGDRTVTTITVDDQKLEAILDSMGGNTTVTLPAGSDCTVVKGELNGQTVKIMEDKDAILEIRTGSITYTLPAAEIDIDAVSEQLGSQVALKDIKVDVTIAQSDADTAKIVENTVNKNSYQVVVKPVEFSITCTNGDKTVEVSKFNGYVERTVAIPDGIDPSKITTGVVLNNDGTISHVPTTIVVIDGKYYAKINSLTNSTYAVIYSPVEFSDISGHWAKAAIDDMGSRLIVSGVGNNSFEPDRAITRAEFTAIIVRALGLRAADGAASFSDVPADVWFSGYIRTAADYKLVTGYSDGTFKPGANITREEAMAIIARAMKLTGLKTGYSAAELSEALKGFADAKDVGTWAADAVGACVLDSLVTGKADQRLAPKDEITRAEVAVLIQRLLLNSGLI